MTFLIPLATVFIGSLFVLSIFAMGSIAARAVERGSEADEPDGYDGQPYLDCE